MEKIGHVIYINLNRRIDRNIELVFQLNKMNISLEKTTRFSAVENTTNPALGCTQSHINVLKLARDKKYKNILILEDDFDFLISRPELDDALNHFFNLNLNWDVIFFSYSLSCEGIPIDNVIGRTHGCQTASGYLVNEHYYDKIINTLEEGYLLLEKTGEHWNYMNDQYWKKDQKTDNWFYFINKIGKQRASYSDLANGITDYNC
jgi:glycosyl transferase family 25